MLQIKKDDGSTLFDTEKIDPDSLVFFEQERGVDKKIQEQVFTIWVKSPRISLSKSNQEMEPMVFVRPQDTNPTIAAGYYSPSNVYYSSRHVGLLLAFDSEALCKVDWVTYCAGTTEAAISGAKGLVIRNETGAITFTSTNNKGIIPYVKSVSVSDITSANWDSPPYTDINHSALSTPYYFLPFWSKAQKTYDIGGGNYRQSLKTLGFKKIDATNVRVQWFEYSFSIISGGSSSFDAYNPSGQNLFILQGNI